MIKKFRIWDKILKKYIDPSGLLFIPFDNDGFIVEQFVGIQDYLDNDIYEGDIIQYGHDQSFIDFVTFKGSAFCANESDFAVDDLVDVLVIGNKNESGQ